MIADTLRPEALRPYLRPGGFGAALHHFEQLGSTQTAALAGAQAGAAEGTLFVAESQTAGRGRHGHAWLSPPGSGIYASLVLRPARPAQALLRLTLAAALAVRDAVTEICGLATEIRWPNDLLLEGKKFCGLLLESAGAHAVLGFGINVRKQAWPEELAAIATALDERLPAPVSRARLCAATVGQLEHRYRRWQAGDDTATLEEFAAACPAVRGHEVVVGGAGDAPFHGCTQGLTAEGYLQVRTADGSLRLATHGDVRPAGHPR